MTTPSPPTPEEFRRKRRVLDQMLTGHSLLRDRYERRALVLTLLVLALSIVATSVAFLSGSTLSILGIQARVQVWVGVLSAVIFFLTLVELRVDWRQRAGTHGDAARRLGRLKSIFRAAAVHDDVVDAGKTDLNLEYDTTMEQLTPIPDNRFLWVKAKHTRKVRASMLLDKHPGAPLWYIRLLAMWHGIRGGDQAEGEEESAVASARKGRSE